jgi:hypothetical protein
VMPKQFHVILNDISSGKHGQQAIGLKKLHSFAVPSFNIIWGRSINASKSKATSLYFDEDRNKIRSPPYHI